MMMARFIVLLVGIAGGAFQADAQALRDSVEGDWDLYLARDIARDPNAEPKAVISIATEHGELCGRFTDYKGKKAKPFTALSDDQRGPTKCTPADDLMLWGFPSPDPRAGVWTAGAGKAKVPGRILDTTNRSDPVFGDESYVLKIELVEKRVDVFVGKDKLLELRRK